MRGLLTLQSSRPEFPAGLKVLFVAPGEGRGDVVSNLESLRYDVTTAASCEEACKQLASSSCDESCKKFDIVLAEAKAVEENGCEAGQSLMAAAAPLPIVLISEKGSSTMAVWRSIEMGAADVLEKPVAKDRLKLIWQHVVRNMLPCNQHHKVSSVAKLDCVDSCAKDSGPTTPRTPSRAPSLGTQSDSLDGNPDSSVSVAGMENLRVECSSDNMTSDSSTSSGVSKPSRTRAKFLLRACRPKAKEFTSGSKAPNSGAKCPPLAIRPPVVGMPATAPMLVNPSGGVYPGLLQVNPQGGCVWGTPVPTCVSPVACAQGMWLAAPVPEATQISTPFKAAEAKGGASEACQAPQLDLWQCDPGASVVMDWVLECGDEETSDKKVPLSMPCVAAKLSPPLKPIGLSLRKSESLLDLINRHLASCRPSTLCA